MTDMSSESMRNCEFVRLWAAHGQRVYAYILTLLPNRSDADDIFQETAATLWEMFDQFELGTNFQAWACRTAWNKIRNFRQLRRHGTILLSTESLESLSQTVLSHSAELDSQYVMLADCYAKLSQHDRELIDMRYQPETTVRKMAKQLERSVDSLYKHLLRIHQALFDCIRGMIDTEGRP
jgi:RNA polymerase sigma-70 factor, ECF subfamily